jgi:hypothetical protein
MKNLSIIILTFFVMSAFVMSAPILASVTTTNASVTPLVSSTATNINSVLLAGDEKDDRPDDADEKTGGTNYSETTTISAAARTWAEQNGFDLSYFEDYTAPADHEPSATDIAAFEQWMSSGSNPRNQVMKQITAAAGEAIAAELWNYCKTIWGKWMDTANVASAAANNSDLKNVGAMQEGMFAGLFGSMLSSTDGNTREYAPARTLIDNGFVVSSDSVTYRLHNMKDGTVVYSMKAPETPDVSLSEVLPEVLTFTDFLPMTAKEPTEYDINLLKEYATAKIEEESSEANGDSSWSDNGQDSGAGAGADSGSSDDSSNGAGQDATNTERAIEEAAANYVNQTFGEYYGQCPGPTVVKGITALGITIDATTENTIGSSVGEREFVSTYFGQESAAGSLWRDGFLPSFDGTTYRLHSGKDGKVVYSATYDQLFNDANSGPNWFLIGGGIVLLVLVSGIVVFIIRKKRVV